MEGTATIQFLPVCSNCKKIIWQPIDYTDNTVYPDKCPNCGIYFVGITMPTRVPFDNSRKE